MVGYHRETHHFREEKSTKEFTAPQHTRFILPLTSPDKIHRCAAWAVFFFYGHLSGRRPLHLANARPFGRSKAPLGLSLLRNRGILLSEETKNPNPSPIEKRFGFSLFGAPDTSAETYHIEFRYGSDAEALSQYDAGEYAYWLASGISTDCDQTMIDNCIELFCTENLAG